MTSRSQRLLTLSLCLVALQGQAADRPARAFAASNATEAARWQGESREVLLDLFHIRDLVKQDTFVCDRPGVDLHATLLASKHVSNYTRYDLEINSTPTRRINVVLTVPDASGHFAAIVAINGHSEDRNTLYDKEEQYHRFAHHFAENSFVTVAADVGQHKVSEEGRILMGERLWDMMRLVDLLMTRPEVDPTRIGVAGLSLGGEMAMWLGAMDSRIKAVVSAGFLTTMSHMRWFHCGCWRFEGLAENFDFADIYSLIAPRPLMLQIGQGEHFLGGFPIDIARESMTELSKSYEAYGHGENAMLFEHEGGHEFIVAPALQWMQRHLN